MDPLNEIVPSAGGTSSSSAEQNGCANPEANGTAHATSHAAPNGQAEPGAPESRDRIERAEEIVDRVSAWVGNMTSLWGRRLVRVGSRIREEAEDFWAEAQNIRRGDKS